MAVNCVIARVRQLQLNCNGALASAVAACGETSAASLFLIHIALNDDRPVKQRRNAELVQMLVVLAATTAAVLVFSRC